MTWRIVVTLVLLACAIQFAGCGLRKVELTNWGPRMEFYESKSEGYDFHIGANAIDKVDNRRGVNKY